jgi:hypothetical protein
MTTRSSRSKQAGLTFPVNKVGKTVKKHFPKKHFKKHVDVRLTAVMEYALGQLLENSAKNVVTGNYITPEHIAKTVADKNLKIHNVFVERITGIK